MKTRGDKLGDIKFHHYSLRKETYILPTNFQVIPYKRDLLLPIL
uniref:Serine/arginine-rich splicing factor SR34A-like n=1 Tax=Rhizophora mucronata TaxID=61149 RepID=A0A2P2LQI8_RHIMU